MDNIKSKSINAAIWSAVDKFGEQGVKFVLGIIVARLLFPSDYGLIGMLAVFIALPDTLVNSGFGTALIQKKSATNTDFATVFYFNIVTGFLLYFVLYLSAPLIAVFFNEPQLAILTRVLGLNVIISSFAIVQRTILIKKLDFKTQTKINLSSIFPSGIIGVLFAYYGYGVWAIVFQSLSRQFLITISFWIFGRWYPKLVFSMQSLKSLFSFGSKILVVGLMNTVYSRIYLIIIGKFYNAELLGFYTRGLQFVTLPSGVVTSIIDRIAFPMFSSIQNNNQQLLNGYRKSVKISAFINFPVMLGLMVVSKPLIMLILTEKWMPSVPYLQILCLAGLLTPMQHLTLSLIKAKGDSGLFLRLDIFKKILVTVIILIVYRWGIMALVYSSVVMSYLAFYINFYFVGKKLNFSFAKQLLDLLPYISIAVITAVIMYVSGIYISDSDILQLIVQVFMGILTYIIINKIFKTEAFEEMTGILVVIKSKIKNR